MLPWKEILTYQSTKLILMCLYWQSKQWNALASQTAAFRIRTNFTSLQLLTWPTHWVQSNACHHFGVDQQSRGGGGGGGDDHKLEAESWYFFALSKINQTSFFTCEVVTSKQHFFSINIKDMVGWLVCVV